MSMFERIIGHARQIEALSRMHGNASLPHALLVTGPEGVGKRALAEALLDGAFDGADTRAHPDIVRVGPLTDEKTGKRKRVIGVEQVREARERFSMSALGGRKALVIEEAGALNDAAANALLKTLEEPRGDALMVLISEAPDALPATIRSRCQHLALSLVPEADIAAALEKRGLARSEADELAALSLGRPGRAIRLIEDTAYRAETETAAAQLEQLAQASAAERLRRAGELLPKGEGDKAQAALDLLRAWEPALRSRMRAQAGTGRADVGGLEALLRARAALTRNANPQIAIEQVLLAL